MREFRDVTYLSALTPQIAFTHTVREFIRELLKRFVPGKWIDRVISEDEATFDAKLDAALIGLDEKTATSKDYRASVVSVLCDEVSSICEVTRLVCINRGYDEYAATYLSSEKFVKMLLRQDREKLKRMKAALDDKTKPLCNLLREIGAILEDRPMDESALLGAAEAKKANAELKAFAADMKKTMQTGFREVNDNIKAGVAAVGEKVDAVDAKVSKLRKNGKPRGRYDWEAKAICWSCWSAAVNHEEVWRSVNTRITYEAVFKFYQGRLTKYGVNDSTEFRGIIRAEEKCRNRELQTRQDEARKSASKSNTKRGENGIMSSVKTRAATALALTLAVVGAMALPLRSAASSQDLRGTSPQSHVAASYAPPSAFPAAPQPKEMRHLAASEQTKLHHKLATIDKMDALSLYTQILPHFIAECGGIHRIRKSAFAAGSGARGLV